MPLRLLNEDCRNKQKTDEFWNVKGVTETQHGRGFQKSHRAWKQPSYISGLTKLGFCCRLLTCKVIRLGSVSLEGYCCPCLGLLVGSVTNAPLALPCGQSLMLWVRAGGENKSTKGGALCTRLSECESLKHVDEALVHCRSPVWEECCLVCRMIVASTCSSWE